MSNFLDALFSGPNVLDGAGAEVQRSWTWQFVGLSASYANGRVTIAAPTVIPSATFQWAASVANPTITQADNTENDSMGGAQGEDLLFQAQSCTGSMSFGGDLILASGDGTELPGKVVLRHGTASRLETTQDGLLIPEGNAPLDAPSSGALLWVDPATKALMCQTSLGDAPLALTHPPITRRDASSVIVAYAEFSGWTLNAGTGNKADTTTTRVRGASVATITTDGAGTARTLKLESIATALDLSDAFARIWVRCDRPDVFASAGLSLYLGSDNSISTNNRRVNFHPSASTQTAFAPNEWTVLELPINSGGHLGTDTGTPLLNSINSIQLRVADNNTGVPITLSIGGLEFVTRSATFGSGVITFTFDDGLASLTAAEEVLSKYGFPGVAYVIPDRIRGTSWAGVNATSNFASLTDLHNLQNASRWDICYHDDIHYPKQTPVGLVDRAHLYQRLMRSRGLKAVHHTAYPGGNWSYNDETLAHDSRMPELQRLFSSGRTITDRYTAQPSPMDPYRLPTLYINGNPTIATVQGWIDAVKANKSWGILVFHDITTGAVAGNSYAKTGPNSLDTIAAYVAAQGVPVRTMTEMLG